MLKFKPIITTALANCVLLLSLFSSPLLFAVEQGHINYTAKQIQQRERLNVTTPEPAYSQDDIEAEIIFGKELAAKVAGKFPPLKDDKLNAYVNKVGQLVAQSSQRSELSFHFLVLNTPEINAFAAPGGYIFITTGALSFVRDESELAAILAHEIAHIEKRHYVKKVGIRSNKGDPEAGFTTILTGGGASATQAFQQAIDEGMEILFSKGLQSRTDEFEADRTAIWLLANAGYDPMALKRYFDRLIQTKGVKTDMMNHTHPPLKTRSAAMHKLIKQHNLAELQQAKLEDRFNENK